MLCNCPIIRLLRPLQRIYNRLFAYTYYITMFQKVGARVWEKIFRTIQSLFIICFVASSLRRSNELRSHAPRLTQIFRGFCGMWGSIFFLYSGRGSTCDADDGGTWVFYRMLFSRAWLPECCGVFSCECIL